jgi:SAM-dependent methyltransferase
VAPQAASPTAGQEAAGSGHYDPTNLLDRLSRKESLEANYEYMRRRETAIIRRYLELSHGDVLSVGAGWHPGRHLFPSPAFRLVAVDADAHRVEGLKLSGRADEVLQGYAGRLTYPEASFDVVLYRLVLHHIAFQGPLSPCFEEASRLLRPGGALVIIEPGLWHPVGAALALANRAGLGPRIHGTDDDIPLSPRTLEREAAQVGLDSQLHAVTFGWRRLPRSVQENLRVLDRLGSRPRAARFGHTLLLIARRASAAAPHRPNSA